MKAMIFAAGLGSRLKSVTRNTPKALVEVGGVPMIERVLLKLKFSGITHVMINLHHYPGQIKTFLKSKNNFGLNITFSDETDQLLETGGGLMKASWFFTGNEPFLVHNVDVLSDVDLTEMWNFHQQHKPLTSLFVQARESSRYLLFNDDQLLKGWINNKTGETILLDNSPVELTSLAFNGIHIISPEIFNLINETGVFSITKSYLNLAKKYQIKGFISASAKYLDIGKPESLIDGEKLARAMDNNNDYIFI